MPCPPVSPCQKHRLDQKRITTLQGARPVCECDPVRNTASIRRGLITTSCSEKRRQALGAVRNTASIRRGLRRPPPPGKNAGPGLGSETPPRSEEDYDHGRQNLLCGLVLHRQKHRLDQKRITTTFFPPLQKKRGGMSETPPRSEEDYDEQGVHKSEDEGTSQKHRLDQKRITTRRTGHGLCRGHDCQKHRLDQKRITTSPPGTVRRRRPPSRQKHRLDQKRITTACSAAEPPDAADASETPPRSEEDYDYHLVPSAVQGGQGRVRNTASIRRGLRRLSGPSLPGRARASVRNTASIRRGLRRSLRGFLSAFGGRMRSETPPRSEEDYDGSPRWANSTVALRVRNTASIRRGLRQGSTCGTPPKTRHSQKHRLDQKRITTPRTRRSAACQPGQKHRLDQKRITTPIPHR